MTKVVRLLFWLGRVVFKGKIHMCCRARWIILKPDSSHAPCSLFWAEAALGAFCLMGSL